MHRQSFDSSTPPSHLPLLHLIMMIIIVGASFSCVPPVTYLNIQEQHPLQRHLLCHAYHAMNWFNHAERGNWRNWGEGEFLLKSSFEDTLNMFFCTPTLPRGYN